MRAKTIVQESFDYYKTPVLLVCSPTCTFKCCTEAGLPATVCQNCEWAKAPTRDFDNEDIVEMYSKNHIEKAICFAGLEPMDTFEEMKDLIECFRNHDILDVIIIYTGYNKDEVQDKVNVLLQYKNIIVKFGRFIPNQSHKKDDVLGVELASSNQFAERIC